VNKTWNEAANSPHLWHLISSRTWNHSFLPSLCNTSNEFLNWKSIVYQRISLEDKQSPMKMLNLAEKISESLKNLPERKAKSKSEKYRKSTPTFNQKQFNKLLGSTQFGFCSERRTYGCEPSPLRGGISEMKSYFRYIEEMQALGDRLELMFCETKKGMKNAVSHFASVISKLVVKNVFEEIEDGYQLVKASFILYGVYGNPLKITTETNMALRGGYEERADKIFSVTDIHSLKKTKSSINDIDEDLANLLSRNIFGKEDIMNPDEWKYILNSILTEDYY